MNYLKIEAASTIVNKLHSLRIALNNRSQLKLSSTFSEIDLSSRDKEVYDLTYGFLNSLIELHTKRIKEAVNEL